MSDWKSLNLIPESWQTLSIYLAKRCVKPSSVSRPFHGSSLGQKDGDVQVTTRRSWSTGGRYGATFTAASFECQNEIERILRIRRIPVPFPLTAFSCLHSRDKDGVGMAPVIKYTRRISERESLLWFRDWRKEELLLKECLASSFVSIFHKIKTENSIEAILHSSLFFLRLRSLQAVKERLKNRLNILSQADFWE